MSAKSSQCIPGKVFCRNSKLDLTFIDMGCGRNFRLSLRPVTLRRMEKKKGIIGTDREPGFVCGLKLKIQILISRLMSYMAL